MTIGPDGYLNERVETLYVSEEYKAFLLTGQTKGNSPRAYIYVKPFNTYTDENVLAAVKSMAKPLDADSRISISSDADTLILRDGLTGTQSEFLISRLDKEVRQRLAGSREEVWEKYSKPATPAAARKFTM